MSLLEQSENRPQSYPLDYLLEEDEEIEDFNFDEDVEHDEGDEINEEVQQNAIPLEDDKEKSIEIDDGAIEVDEPFLKAVEEQQTVPAQESASLKGVSQEIPLKGFPQGTLMMIHYFYLIFNHRSSNPSKLSCWLGPKWYACNSTFSEFWKTGKENKH